MSGSTPASYSIEFITSTEGRRALATPRRALEAAAPSINLTASYNWVETWRDVFDPLKNPQRGYSKRLLILWLNRQDFFRAIVPLVPVNRPKFGLPVAYIQFLGQQWGGTVLDIIGLPLNTQEPKEIIDWLFPSRRFDLLHLYYLPASTPNFDLMGAESWLFSACPMFDLTASSTFEEYQAKIYSNNL